MSVHIDRTHHRPRVYKAPGNRSRWSFPWTVTCACGFRKQEFFWHGAYVDAVAHASQVR